MYIGLPHGDYARCSEAMVPALSVDQFIGPYCPFLYETRLVIPTTSEPKSIPVSPIYRAYMVVQNRTNGSNRDIPLIR